MLVRAIVTCAGIDAGRTLDVEDVTEQPYAGCIASGLLVVLPPTEETAVEASPGLPFAPEASSPQDDAPAAAADAQGPQTPSE